MINFIKNQEGAALLIKMLVTIGIFVILSAISIPYIKEYQPNLKLTATARELTVDLRYAQQLTVTEQIPHIVKFDTAGNGYDVLRLDVATTTIKSVVFDSDVDYQQIIGLTDDTVSFNFYGGASESGQVILVNQNLKTSTINIKPSGYIQLAD